MKVSKGGGEDLDMGMNMTPMIDIVFQLIIFFMVVTELATLDLERLTLPYAKSTDTSKDRIDTSNKITVNVTKKGDLKIKRTKYTDEQLLEFIRYEANEAGREPNEDVPNAPPVSRLQVLIRADRDARFEGIQRVFDACQKFGVYKTSVSTTEETHTRDAEG